MSKTRLPFHAERLEGGGLAVCVLPELGGKISELRREGGPNVLLTPGRVALRRRSPGDRFEDHDASGFDECFPTVASCPSPGGGAPLPDHGDLWTSAWSFRREGAGAVMECASEAGSARLSRKLALRDGALRLDYELSARGNGPGPYLWSAHPLLRASAGSRIYLPPEVREVEVQGSSAGRLGARGDVLPWPGGERLDVLGGPPPRTAQKLFAGPLREGLCAFHDAEADESLILRFDPALTPYLGVWICQGGWRGPEELAVALEPCSGMPDALDEAARRGRCPALHRHGSHRWWIELRPVKGPPPGVLGALGGRG